MLRRLLAPVLFLASLAACAQPATPPPTAKPATRPAAAAPAPRLGTDYEVLPVPQPKYGVGRIEVAEVFSYRCIHCAEFQPLINTWKKTMPADARWEYVPAVFGGSWDDFARAYFAADILGVHKKTHDAAFKGIFVDELIKTGTPEEIADMYAKFGVDRAKFLGTMQSFGVTAKLNRARQFALRTGVSATPTIIINGKYRVTATRDRGFAGMLATVDYLIARERAAAPKATPAQASK
ncbi:MAG: thiol:disulfide interchange protein DsbA/DsbL [Arenimonas sp.]|jgi:thiol:disulfide interchange protein DsbA